MPPTKKTSKEKDHKQSQTKNTQKAEGKLRLYQKSDQIVVVIWTVTGQNDYCVVLHSKTKSRTLFRVDE